MAILAIQGGWKMGKIKFFPAVLDGLGVAVFLCAVSTTVFAADKLVLSSAVFQEIEMTDAQGNKKIKRVPAATALPGSELIYVTTYTNTGDKAAEDVIINNPLAKELLYKNQSASGENAKIAVSVDGGKHYGDLAVLRIPTGDGDSRSAQVNDITDLQFKITNPVLPQTEGTVSFRVILK